jgi:hypothetical protein
MVTFKLMPPLPLTTAVWIGTVRLNLAVIYFIIYTEKGDRTLILPL